MLVNSLTIGIPETKPNKFLYVFLNSVTFERRSNYFLTCRFEPIFPNTEGSGRVLRTEVQQNTIKPQFKSNSFSFKLPFINSPSKTPTEPFPSSPKQTPSRKNSLSGTGELKKVISKGVYLEESNCPTIIIQSFEVVHKDENIQSGAGNIPVTCVGGCIIPIGGLLNTLLKGERVKEKFILEG